MPNKDKIPLKTSFQVTTHQTTKEIIHQMRDLATTIRGEAPQGMDITEQPRRNNKGTDFSMTKEIEP